MLIRDSPENLHPFVERAIARNPDIGFFHYARSFGIPTNHAEGLRITKRGLQCTNLTRYVRLGLLSRAAEFAFGMSTEKLYAGEYSEERQREGLVFALSALEDSRMFIDEAPPATEP